MEHPCLIWCALTQNQALPTLLSRSVHASFDIRWIQHLGIQGSCHKNVCANIFGLVLEVTYFYLQIINMYVKGIKCRSHLYNTNKTPLH